MGTITSIMPAGFAASLGIGEEAVKYRKDCCSNGRRSQLGSRSNNGANKLECKFQYLEMDYENLQERFMRIEDALVRMENAIAPYRAGKGVGFIMRNPEYIQATQDFAVLRKGIPEGAIVNYMTQYESLCGEALALYSRKKPARSKR